MARRNGTSARTRTLRQRWAATLGDPALLDGGDPSSTFRGAANATPERGAEPPRAERYALGGALGRGGMGVVHRALQASLRREIAVKRLREDRIRPAEQAAFVAEGRLTSFLDHPNIVPIHDLSSDDEGAPLLAMKLVRGESWRDVLDAQPGPLRGEALEEQLRVLISVCHATAFAHEHGVLHLDLKPDNVMVGDFDEVLLMDWGLATVYRPTRAPLPPRPSIDGPVGTPAYMAPELAMGDGSLLGPWTDVYLLGGMLHRLLTGDPPHTGGTIWEVLASAISETPRPMPADAPPDLTEACLGALRGDHTKRTATVAELLEALELHLEHRASIELVRRGDEALARAAHGETYGGARPRPTPRRRSTPATCSWRRPRRRAYPRRRGARCSAAWRRRGTRPRRAS